MKVPADVLLWLATCYRLWNLQRRRDFLNAAYAAAAVCVAAAFTVATVEHAVDDVLGPYVSDLLEHTLAAAGGVAANLFLLGLRDGRPATRSIAMRALIGFAVLVAMIATFCAAPIHAVYRGDLDTVYGGRGLVVAYTLIFDCYLSYVLIDNVRLCRRYAADAGDGPRSTSLRLIGVGSFVALGYSVSRIIYVAVDRLADVQLGVLKTTGSALAALGLCVLAIGMLIPRTAERALGWAGALRTIHRLRPLWSVVTEHAPTFVLPTALPITPRRAELRSDRLAIETSEALLARGVLLDPAKSPDEMAKEVARSLLSPLAATSSGQHASRLADPDEERASLLRVADAFRRISPGVPMSLGPV